MYLTYLYLINLHRKSNIKYNRGEMNKFVIYIISKQHDTSSVIGLAGIESPSIVFASK